MNQDRKQAAIDAYDRFTHGLIDRRSMLERMGLVAGGAAAAEALIAAIAASPAAAAMTSAVDPRLIIRRGPIGFGSELSGYIAVRKGRAKRGVVLLIHENRGLNAHIEDVARRLALAGLFVVAPDQLSLAGGTPADEDQARELIGKLDLGAAVGRTVALGAALKSRLRHGNGRLGMVGFCWGGAFVDRVAVAAGTTLDAGVAYYGPAPAPVDAVQVQAPLMLHYAGLDTRVAETAGPWVTALRAAGKTVEAFTYPGVNHAFNNDTSAERYDQAAAALAWGRTVDFLHRHLGR